MRDHRRGHPAARDLHARSRATSRAVAEPELRIVHLDDDLAVVDKPAGLVVHPAPSHTGPTLVDELGDLLGGGDPERPGIVHRLDKDTSGLMVVARDDGGAGGAAGAGPARARSSASTWRWPAGGSARGRGRSTRRSAAPRASATGWPSPGAASREARTHFEVLELLPRESYVEARLETGRTHQIRAHFAAIGHPLTGDPTYGGARPLRPRAPVPARPPARLRASRAAASGSSSPRRCRPTSRAALEAARAA